MPNRVSYVKMQCTIALVSDAKTR